MKTYHRASPLFGINHLAEDDSTKETRETRMKEQIFCPEPLVVIHHKRICVVGTWRGWPVLCCRVLWVNFRTRNFRNFSGLRDLVPCKTNLREMV